MLKVKSDCGFAGVEQARAKCDGGFVCVEQARAKVNLLSASTEH